jgi:hypothetical protein
MVDQNKDGEENESRIHYRPGLNDDHFKDELESEALEDQNLRVLKRRGDAKPPRKENVPIGMVRCDICGALVPKSRFEEHIQKSHSEQTEILVERCPICNAEVRTDRMEKHIRKVHPDR